jgi:HPr kinase/phosphorylase
MSRSLVLLHGTAVAFDGLGAVFLRGPSGTGKSDLAFRLIQMGARLVADDQVAFAGGHGILHALPIDVTRGMIEVRGLGLVRLPVADEAPMRLVVDLVARDDVPRMPQPGQTARIAGVDLRRLALHAFDASTPLKILKALEIIRSPSLLME